MAAFAPALDPLTGRTSVHLGANQAPADVVSEEFCACFRFESDGSLRLLALEAAGPSQSAPLPD